MSTTASRPCHTRYRVQTACLVLMMSGFTTGGVSAQPEIEIVLPERPHPCVTCTAEELARLRQAYRGQGAEHDIVAARVAEAERFVEEPITFPPRGGQHNQWYQCDECEIALKTIDDTHHQCPKCQTIYSGPPYDDVIFSHQHSRNLQRMLTAAWAYAASGDDRFAEYSARVLLGYAERYSQYPYHSNSQNTTNRSGGHLFEQTLNEASTLATQIGPAYDLIHDSDVLSPAEHEMIRTGLLLPMLQNIDKNKTGKNNWQTWHNAAMIWGGALVKDPFWVRKAISDPQNGFQYQMGISVSKEGMWYENSWGYHFYTLHALINTAETTRRLGIDLWSDTRLRNMFTLPIYYTMADGMLPRFGDDTGSSVRGAGRSFEPAYRAYNDPQILSLLSREPTFESILLGRRTDVTADPPALKSMVFEDAGHTILRANGRAGMTAAMTFGPYGGFHGHYDKLSFVFFGFEKELGVDPGRARSQAYRLPIHSNWYKATISHNAVLVDGKSQKPAAGKLLRFQQADGFTAVAASCDDAYPGVQHTRRLVMTDAYLLVLDQLHSDTEHRFDWLYHNRGRQAVCETTAGDANLADYPGGAYILNARQGATADMVRVRFEDAETTTHLILAGGQDTTVTVGDGVGGSITDRVPMAMIGRTGRDVMFAAVLEPVPAAGRPRVTGVRLTPADDGPVVVVEHRDGVDTIAMPAGQGVSLVRSDIQTLLTINPGPDNPRNSEGDIIELKDGRLCLVYTRFTGGGDDDAAADLAMRISTDQGRSWSDDTIVVRRTGGLNVMSISLLRLASGEIALFYLLKTSEEDCRPRMCLSTDEARTWSPPACCITDEVGYYVLNNDRAVQLRSGRLILPVAWHQDPGHPRDSAGIIMCYLSDDNGKTWRRSNDPFKAYGPDGRRITLQEPGVVELKDGRLMMYIRTDAGSQYVCHSPDGGQTWSKPGPSPLASPLSPATIERIPWTGDLLCIWNDHSGRHPFPKDRRTPLCMAISKDEGETWSPSLVIEDNPDGWYCYTSITFTENRAILSYCAGDKQVGGLNRLKVLAIPRDCLTRPF
ncbi:MAG: exo-alpha-sialidase [Phycisphaerales bacterium]